MHRQAELSTAGGENNEQCLITKVLGGATGATRLKSKFEIGLEFRLGESNDKALSAEHIYQVEPRDPKGLSALLFRGSGREPKRANGDRRPRRNR